MPEERRSQRIVIAGASSLLGGEVKAVLEESRFATWDLRLVDEEVVAGTLTEAGGEATIIQPVEEDTFHGARYAFLTGSAGFGKQCLAAARASGVRIIDFTGASLSDPDAAPWFSRLESLSGRRLDKKAKVFLVCSAGGTAVAMLALSLREFGLRSLVAVLFQPVSEAGREGIEELETQTSQLLSFQNVGSPVFGTQAAFNLLPCYGEESRQSLHQALMQIRAEVAGAFGDGAEDGKIAVNLVHAPVFYGMTFSGYAELSADTQQAALIDACKAAGFSMVSAKEPGPSNVSVAGENTVFLRSPEADGVRARGWWFWGAADNLRLPAWNGCKLAEWLEE